MLYQPGPPAYVVGDASGLLLRDPMNALQMALYIAGQHAMPALLANR